METKKLTETQITALKKPLPDEAVTQHPTKTFLSSIKAIYVIERLNEVFSIGAWHLRSEIIDNKTSMIVVKSTLSIPEYGIELESYGGNNNGGENSKNFDLGDAYKGATTDALTKICSFLEIGMDVFKGKQQGKSKQPASTEGSEQKQETVWLTQDQFDAAMKSDKKGIIATLNAYNGKAGKAMKKDYTQKLTEQLSIAPSSVTA